MPLPQLTEHFPASIYARYELFNDSSAYTITCKYCRATWTHPLRDPKVATLLALLNHSIAHESPNG
jgi:hypothetical protein